MTSEARRARSAHDADTVDSGHRIDVERVKAKYRRNAVFYDWFRRFERRRGLRVDAVERLGLAPGNAVLDLGCGTGGSFELLEAAVGPTGRIVGLDVSPDMLARAREEVERNGWRNVRLVEANAEDVDLPRSSVDAILSFYTHDLMTSRRALTRVLSALRSGGRFVASGGKRASGLRGAVLSLLTLPISLPFVTTMTGAERPWSVLEELLGGLEVEERLGGTAYLAVGVKR